MTLRQEAARPSAAAPPLGKRYRLAAASLAVYAVVTPLGVAALAGPLPLRFLGTLALATSLLGPGLATVAVCWRGLAAIVEALAARPDAEPLQAILRIFMFGAVLAYLGALGAAGAQPELLQPLLAIDVAGALGAWLVLLHLMLRPERTARRRAVAMAYDVVVVSAFLHWGDAAAAPFASAYLWIGLGCALVSGAAMVRAAALMSVVGFAVVAATTPIWHDVPAATAAILVALVVLAPCTAALAHRLAATRDEAERTRQAKARLLAVLGHELRTPLNTLIGMATLVARTRLDAEQRDMLATMQLAAHALLGLVNDLIELSMIEAGGGAPKVESFVLREVLGVAVAILRPQAEAKGLDLAFVVDPRLPHVCRGLKLQLRQVLMNLLANAIRLTPRGHVGVAATLADRTEGAVRLRLVVRDEGSGIAAAARAHLLAGAAPSADSAPGSGLGLAIAQQFVAQMGGSIEVASEDGAGNVFTVEIALACDADEAVRPDLLGRRVVLVTPDREFAATLQAWLTTWRSETQWHADGDDALRVLGDGSAARHILLIDGRTDPLAGLSLAHRLATAAPQRATIIFVAPPQASEAVAGLAATQLAAVIEEPVSEAALANAMLSALAAAGEDGPDEAAPAAASASAGWHVLVADDDAANRETLKSMLVRAGHQVELAADGGAALALLDTGRFDVALLDLAMQGVSGDAVAKLHRLRHPGAALPLVALAADATSETERLCREAGFDTVLTRPLEAAPLLAAIDALCAERAARPGPPAARGPGVTPISSHPRFLAEGAEIVHEATIESLRGLGGNDFVAEVVDTFRSDAARLVDRLRQAVERGNLAEFAELAHSLRSGAANIGGVRLCQTLTALEDVTAKELRQAGALYVEKIAGELVRLEAALEPFARAHRLG